MYRYLGQEVRSAERELRREQLSRFGSEIKWLIDPEIIQEEVLGEAKTPLGQCYKVGDWMVGQFASWSGSTQSKLSWGETFEKHKLPNEYRVAIRQKFMPEGSKPAYIPGILAVAEVFGAVPVLATRDNIPNSRWLQIALQAEAFAASLSQDGTTVQALARTYLQKPADNPRLTATTRPFDESKLRLDSETGIAPVTSIDTILAASRLAAANALNHVEQLSGACVALQAKAPCQHAGANMFGAVWQAFGSVANRFIYPKANLDGEPIALPAAPESQETIAAIMNGILQTWFEDDAIPAHDVRA